MWWDDIIDINEFMRRLIKYIVMGFMIALVTYAIPKQSLNFDEIAMVSLSTAATFCILDTYLPSIGVSARNGAGLGIGATLVGFPGGLM